MGGQSLKQKTTGALLWNLLDRVGQQVLLFIVGIIVANILEVEDYALVGMLAIFSAVSAIIIDSGFSAALIQKKEVTEKDCCSVFWFNLMMSVALYFLLIAASPLIARFFGQPKLAELSVILFLALPLNSLGLIQSTILNREVRFNILTRINLIAVLFSGVSSLIIAYAGLGVWALVFQPVILAACRTLLLWRYSSWRPRLLFRGESIRQLLGFASALLAASLINTCFLNIYSVVIAKIYPAKQLGYYTQGNKMCDMGVTMLYGSIQNATFPIFSSIQDEKERLMRAFRKTMRFTAFVTFPAMFGLAAVARPLIELLLEERWWPAVPFLQLLCLAGCFTILTAVNNNFIKVSGNSRGILRVEYVKVFVTLLCLLFTYKYPVLIMVAGLAVARFLVYVATVISTFHYTGYKVTMQLRDVLPYLLLALIMVAAVYPIGWWIQNNLLLLLAQAIVGAGVYLLLAYLTGSKIIRESFTLLFRRK